MNRQERRSQAARERRGLHRQLQDLGLYRRTRLLVLGDPANDTELLRVITQHERDLADPTISPAVRTALEESLQRVRMAQLLDAEFSPQRPASPAEAH